MQLRLFPDQFRELVGRGPVAQLGQPLQFTGVAVSGHLDQLVGGRAVAPVGESSEFADVLAFAGELDEFVRRIRAPPVGEAAQLGQVAEFAGALDEFVQRIAFRSLCQWRPALR